jgi:hypothetical protein
LTILTFEPLANKTQNKKQNQTAMEAQHSGISIHIITSGKGAASNA